MTPKESLHPAVSRIAQRISRAAVPAKRRKIAFVVAGVADLVQAGLFPFFSQGVLSIPDDILDVVVAILLVAILGFRWRLLLALALELIPVVAIFPSWTAVVLSLPAIPEPLPVRPSAFPPPPESPLSPGDK